MTTVPTIHTVVTHFEPQVDEMLAWWMAYRSGEKHFPGIRQAKLRLTDAGLFTPDGRPVTAWENEGHLVLGVWGSRFDEHALPLEEQNQGQCAATLMADYLGLSGDENFSSLLEFVSNNDSQGGSTPFDIAAITKDLNSYFNFQGRMAAKGDKQFPPEVQTRKLRDILFPIFDAKLAQNREFMKAVDMATLAKKKANDDISYTSVDCADGQERLVAVITSNNRQAAKAVRALRPRPDIIIQRRGNGQVMVSATGSMPLDEVAVIVMAEEKRLGKLTDHEVARRWLHFKRGSANWLLNGSISAPGVPGTKLHLGYLKRIVCEELKKYVASPEVRRRELRHA